MHVVIDYTKYISSFQTSEGLSNEHTELELTSREFSLVVLRSTDPNSLGRNLKVSFCNCVSSVRTRTARSSSSKITSRVLNGLF